MFSPFSLSRISGAFTKDQADSITGNVWTRLGMSPADKATWTEQRINMPSHFEFDASEFAPRAWAAICELCGGQDRIKMPWSKMWKDSLIVNLGTPEGEGRSVHPHQLYGWHVDGTCIPSPVPLPTGLGQRTKHVVD